MKFYKASDADDYTQISVNQHGAAIIETHDDDGGLLKRFRAGDSAIPAMIEDYAFFIWGLIELSTVIWGGIELHNVCDNMYKTDIWKFGN